ncbi:MAG TPA: metallopeptidase family protein [Chloroflexota bacterium]|nr:metallopeptidase family protein [Chloroflexota bacterium]
MRRRIRLSRGRIRRYVERALDSLPAQFREAADNVMVAVENRPTPEDERGHEKRRRSAEPLMGIYRGVPLSERAGYQLVTPDVIAIFRKPILRLCRTRREAEEEVRLTVLHEFGHFLGLEEDQVEHL